MVVRHACLAFVGFGTATEEADFRKYWDVIDSLDHAAETRLLSSDELLDRSRVVQNLMVQEKKKEVDVVKGEVVRFFSEKFKEEYTVRHKLVSSRFSKLSRDKAAELEACFTLEEIKAVV
ncbi:hypothetical protein L1887_15097 [Cichorium endivia]|nr:hypothetical protein L1887_15097 [Cichorium endivia]